MHQINLTKGGDYRQNIWLLKGTGLSLPTGENQKAREGDVSGQDRAVIVSQSLNIVNPMHPPDGTLIENSAHVKDGSGRGTTAKGSVVVDVRM